LTKEEEENIIGELIKKHKKQKDIAKIFTKTTGRISQIIKASKYLTSLATKQTKSSTVNELLDDTSGKEVAKLYDISPGRVSQIWGDFQDGLIDKFNQGISKIELINEQDFQANF